MFEKLNQVGEIVIGATKWAGPVVEDKASSALPYVIPGALMLGAAAMLSVAGFFLARRYCKPQDEAEIEGRSNMATLERNAEEGVPYQRMETPTPPRRHSVS